MNYAYITLLSSRTYYDGVLILHRSLLSVNARYPLLCMISKGLEREVVSGLQEEGIRCICLQDSLSVNSRNKKCHLHWDNTFDKLHVWGMTRYEKLIYLDSDMVIVRNIDHLFSYPAFSAVSAGCSYPGNEHWIGALNSGLMVVEPDSAVERCLMNSIQSVVSKFYTEGKDVGDQDVIKEYCKDWALKSDLHLDEGYNMFADYLTYYIRKCNYTWLDGDGKELYVIHFIGKVKPWMKKNIKNLIWLFLMICRNPLYLSAYRYACSFLRLKK